MQEKRQKLSAKAVKLLRKVKEHILAQPKQLDMHDWGTVKVQEGEVCNTVGCIGGWVYFLSKPKEWKKVERRALADGILAHTYAPVEDEAGKLLGLTQEQRERLFFFRSWGTGNGWPEKFENQYQAARTARGRASATARRIERFIATNGAE